MSGAGIPVRRTAAETLVRIERDGAYANLALPAVLERSGLSSRDRSLATEMVYGVTRMRRSLDWLVDRFVVHPPDLPTRTYLRLGAYQIVFMRIPPHAAVSATVGAAPKKVGGFINAVLRKVAAEAQPPNWPDDATRLSYPDWIIDLLSADLGADRALAALEAMDQRGVVNTRADGYIQDRASQWVAQLVGAEVGERVLDAAAAPGGKATLMAGGADFVVAADQRVGRVGLVEDNIERLALDNIVAMAADGRNPPFRPGSFDRVLLDAPCSGLGTLSRRADARWRIESNEVEALSELQRRLVDALVPMVKPGGTFVYSVCTLSAAETRAVDGHIARVHPSLVPIPPPAAPWEPSGRGALLLPQTEGTDGMYLLRLRASS